MSMSMVYGMKEALQTTPQGVLTWNGTVIPWEVFFQHEDHLAFSPATQSFSMENLILILFLVKLSKTPEGMKTLERIAVKYLDSCARIVESVESACHQNWLTALNNQHIAAAIAHRIGLIDDGGYIKIVEHYRSVFDKQYVLGGVEALGTLVIQGVQAAAPGGISDIAALIKGLRE